MLFLRSARGAALLISLGILAACAGGPSTLPNASVQTADTGAARHAMNNGNGVETPPNCTFSNGITTCATTTSVTSTVAVGPTCSQTVTTTTTSYTAHHGKDPHGEELPAPPSTTTTTNGAVTCPTNSASMYKTNFFRPACNQNDATLRSYFPVIATVTTADQPNGDVKVHIAITRGDANANYVAAESCVTFVSPLIHTDATGTGSGDFVLAGAAGHVAGFDMQVVHGTNANDLVWYDSAQTGLFTI